MSGKPRMNFAKLVEAARREQPPAIDVTDRVLNSVLSGRTTRSSDWSLWVASLVSVAAAAAVMTLAEYQGALAMDPLVELIRGFVPTIQ
jgi:hypothetical protein